MWLFPGTPLLLADFFRKYTFSTQNLYGKQGGIGRETHATYLVDSEKEYCVPRSPFEQVHVRRTAVLNTTPIIKVSMSWSRTRYQEDRLSIYLLGSYFLHTGTAATWLSRFWLQLWALFKLLYPNISVLHALLAFLSGLVEEGICR